MALYTKCPACRSEIAFEPPANTANLPESYRHRIKCPSCGVTIGVKLNTVARQPVQETPLAIQSVDATTTRPYPQAAAQEQAVESVPARSLDKPKKKAGTGRNILMMIFSLLFIAVSVLAYLINSERVKLPLENDFGLSSLDGILWWELLVKNFDAFKALFQADAVLGLIQILPMIIFTLSCITFIVAFISACGKKYGRAFNVIWAIIIFALGVIFIFGEYITDIKMLGEGPAIGEYFKDLFGEAKSYACLIPAVLGLLQLIFSLIFIKSLKIKEKK